VTTTAELKVFKRFGMNFPASVMAVSILFALSH